MSVQTGVQVALGDLYSEDGTRQGAALLAIERAVKVLAGEAVDALRRGPHRLLVAERLYFLGSAVVPPLQDLFASTNDPDVKLNAALVLMQFGMPEVGPWLLDQIEYGDANAAAGGLRRAGSTGGVAERIIARLRRWGPPQGSWQRLDEVAALLDTLEGLGDGLPEDLRQRFAKVDVHKNGSLRWIDWAELGRIMELEQQSRE